MICNGVMKKWVQRLLFRREDIRQRQFLSLGDSGKLRV